MSKGKSELAHRIAETRKRCGLKQTDVAKRLYCTNPCVSHWEHGRSEPNATQIVGLCKLFGVSADYLLGIKED